MRYCCLQDLLKEKKELVGAEIGVWEGDNAYALFKNLDIVRLYLIDPYIGYMDLTQGKELVIRDFEKAKGNAISLIGEYPAVWIYEKSEDAVSRIKEKLDFVYIDASHQYKDVLKDLEVWYPKVKKGGVVSGHDYNIKDIQNAVLVFCSSKDIHFETLVETFDNPEHEWWFKV